jgi:hypothetical protein
VIADAAKELPADSFTIDGAAAVCNHDGVAVFDALQYFKLICLGIGNSESTESLLRTA